MKLDLVKVCLLLLLVYNCNASFKARRRSQYIHTDTDKVFVSM